ADASSNGSGGGSCRPVTPFSGGGPVGVAGSGAGSGAGAGAGGRSGTGAGGSQATGSAGRAGSGRRVGAAGPPTPAPPAATRTSTPRTSWIAPATTWSLPLLVKPLASFGREKPSRTVLPSTPTGPTSLPVSTIQVNRRRFFTASRIWCQAPWRRPRSIGPPEAAGAAPWAAIGR